MKTLSTIFTLLLVVSSICLKAQSADQIIEKYIENIGGKSNWEKVKAITMKGEMKTQNMKIPFQSISTATRKQQIKIELQGNNLVWSAFDGEKAWERNQINMKPEWNDRESSENLKNELIDFPDPFLNYKQKGYKIELVGKETIQGVETYKIKLVRKPLLIDGKTEPNISYYYFDTENFVPIVSESLMTKGKLKGKMIKTSLSDYQQVKGLYFPFSMSNDFQKINFKEITLNAAVSDVDFGMPSQ